MSNRPVMDQQVNKQLGALSPRVVSLLPSITEVVAALGAASHVVGITHECDYPPEVMDRHPSVVTSSDISPYTMTQEQIHEAVCGSLKNGHSLYGLNAKVLEAVKPDIIFTQQLCDVCAVSYPVVLETCAKLVAGPKTISENEDDSMTRGQQSDPAGTQGINGCTRTKQDVAQIRFSVGGPKVISLEPSNLEDVFTTLRVAGRALGPIFEQRALIKIGQLQQDLESIRFTVAQLATIKPKVAFFEWHSPIFSGGHWIADMMEVAGAQYDMCASGQRSYPMKDNELAEMDPDFILIGPCGFTLERSVQDTLTLLYGVGEEKNESGSNNNPSQDKNQRVAWWKSLRAVREGNVFCLDGNSYYARPGPRLVQGAGIIAACIHGPEVASALGERLAPANGYHCISDQDRLNRTSS